MKTFIKKNDVNNKILVPTLYFEKGKRKFVLIGMMHVSNTSFFKIVSDTISKHEKLGYKIFYESSDPHLKFSPLKKGDRERWRSEVGQYIKTVVNFYNKFSFFAQSHEIKIKRNWKNSDYTRNMWYKNKFIKNIITFSNSKIFKSKEYTKKRLYLSLVCILGYYSTSSVTTLNSRTFYKSVNRQIPLFQRDDFASRILLKALKTDDVLTFWGAAHIPGIRKNVEKAGFKLKKVTWHEVLDLKKLSDSIVNNVSLK